MFNPNSDFEFKRVYGGKQITSLSKPLNLNVKFDFDFEKLDSKKPKKKIKKINTENEISQKTLETKQTLVKNEEINKQNTPNDLTTLHNTIIGKDRFKQLIVIASQFLKDASFKTQIINHPLDFSMFTDLNTLNNQLTETNQEIEKWNTIKKEKVLNIELTRKITFSPKRSIKTQIDVLKNGKLLLENAFFILKKQVEMIKEKTDQLVMKDMKNGSLDCTVLLKELSRL